MPSNRLKWGAASDDSQVKVFTIVNLTVHKIRVHAVLIRPRSSRKERESAEVMLRPHCSTI